MTALPAPPTAQRLLAALVLIAALVVGSLVAGTRPASALEGDLRMHDPSVLKVGACWYGASTGFEGGPGNGSVTIRKTCDKSLYGGWTYVGTVWDAVPAWITERLGATPPNIWAPDLNYVNGEFRLYYGASIWGQQDLAVMGLLTAKDIEGPWTDAGQVTDVNYPIDPNVVTTQGRSSVIWGSWPGVYLHALDRRTGKLSTTEQGLHKIASGIEGASLVEHGGYFYLFGSKGSCCSGVDSTYYTVVGRSTSVTGPFLDRNGVDMNSGGGTTVLTGKSPKVAAGGGDVFEDRGSLRFAYHYYDAEANGRETLDIRTIEFVDGWPVMSEPVQPGA